MCADQGVASASGERAEGVVHIGDAAGGVAPHDDVPLRLEKTLGVLLGLLDLPFAIGDLLEARFQALDLLLHGALAMDHQRERAAGRDRQAGQQRQVRMEMPVRKTGAIARHDPIEGGDDRDRSGDGQSGDDDPPGAARYGARLASGVVGCHPHVRRLLCPVSHASRACPTCA